MQCKITIGGNIGATIIYREAVLPLLLCDCQVLVAGSNGLNKVCIHDIFNKRLQLAEGDFIVQFIIEKQYMTLPFVHIKKTKNEKIDYPLLSVAAIKKDDKIRIAMSGVCAFPFRCLQVEDTLNDRSNPIEIRAGNAINCLPSPILNDTSGSDNYRKFALKNTLINTLQTLEKKQ